MIGGQMTTVYLLTSHYWVVGAPIRLPPEGYRVEASACSFAAYPTTPLVSEHLRRGIFIIPTAAVEG
jgi:hypothetical protein